MDTYQASRSPTTGVRLDPISFPRVIYDRNNVSLVNMSQRVVPNILQVSYITLPVSNSFLLNSEERMACVRVSEYP